MSVRKITVKSGNEEFTLDVTEEEYRNYFRMWWRQKKHEQRNREAMEWNSYTEEAYEAWRDNASEGVGIPDIELPGVDEWLDGFNTFSIYQVLPQLIELWGMNVQTDVEAKKTSPN